MYMYIYIYIYMNVQSHNHRIVALGQPTDSISLCWNSRTPCCISSINRWILSWIPKGASDQERRTAKMYQNVWIFHSQIRMSYSYIATRFLATTMKGLTTPPTPNAFWPFPSSNLLISIFVCNAVFAFRQLNTRRMAYNGGRMGGPSTQW